MKYKAIEANRGTFPVRRLCEVLEVSRSQFYEWRAGKVGRRAQEDADLTLQIEEIARCSRYTYGVPRLHAELQARGVRIGKGRISRLMKAAGIQVRWAKSFKPRTTQVDPSKRFAPNHLNRDFQATAPNQKWLGDITYIPTREGFLYVAAIQDLFSRRIVGLAMDTSMPTELVERALVMACQHENPPQGLLHHSDRGSQYTSHKYQAVLADHHMLVSMSRSGDCFDNAPIESFWATLKRECADFIFDTIDLARTHIFDYIMTFYNRQRRHSALGYRSPLHFEQQFMRQLYCPA